MKHSNMMAMLNVLDTLERWLVRLSPYLIIAVLVMAAVGVASAQDMMRVVRGGWRREEAAPAGPTNIPQFASSITWYRFNEFTNSAGKHVDSSYVGTNTAVPTAGAASPTWVSADQGIYLDGGDYSSQDVGYILNGLTAITWSVWLSNKTFTTYDGILCARGDKLHGIDFDVLASEVACYLDHTRTRANITNTVAWTNAGWTHIVFTLVCSDTPVAYINGILTPLKSSAVATNTEISGQTDGIKIGFDDFSSDRKFYGNIDDCLIYSTALTSNEVWQLYQFGH